MKTTTHNHFRISALLKCGVILFFLLLTARYSEALTISDSTVYGRAVYVIDWTDNDGKPRKFCLVKDADQAYVGIAQYMKYYDGNTQVTIATPYPNGGAIDGGFGSTVHHSSPGPNQHRATSGHVLTLAYQGPHHAIFNWTQTISGAIETVTYTFMDGHDYFQWQNTTDANGGTVLADSRGPYCTMQWDGMDFSAVTGQEYGAAKYFSQPSYNGAWTFSGTVDIPYVLEWDNNREIGYVQTQTFTQQVAGQPNWGGSWNLAASGAKIDGFGGSYSAPTGDEDWALDFQMNAYDGAKKITWGLPYGYMNNGNGTNTYNGASVGNKNGWGQYSVSVVLDAMSEAGVKRVRDENRAIQNGSVSLTANTGSIVTTGPVGTVNPATQTLSPAGYDHNYRTWWVNADASGNTDITMTVTGATLQNPTFRIKSSGSLPTSVKYNSTLLTDGVDYFASYNSSASEVWITIVRSVTGTANLQVSSSAATTALMPVGKDMLKVYPNPFSGRVVVETTQMPGASGLCEVELINSLGQVIFSEKTSSPETEINTSSYPSGVYILRVKKENYVSNQSLVKL